MKIVTAGCSYVDIDAYGGCIAYAELLRELGQDAQAVHTSKLNSSVSPTVRSWPVKLSTTYTDNAEDTFVVIDLSDPEYFEKFVDLDRLDEVIDHHTGHEEYWSSRKNTSSQIEFIGSACTIVFERWLKSGKLDQISTVSARLLLCGILDNTLNLRAAVTTQRDKEAYEQLLTWAELPVSWPEEYFRECTEHILDNPTQAADDDTKDVQYPDYKDEVKVAQLALWSFSELTDANIEAIASHMSGSAPWIVNMISIKDGISYFLTEGGSINKWLESNYNINFSNRIGVAERMWLRKELYESSVARTQK